MRWDSTTPFGRAFRARGEQDRGPVVGGALHQRLLGIPQAAELVAKCDGGADVVQIDDLDRRTQARDQPVEPALFDEGARREDGVDLRGLAGRQHVGDAGREVDHRRHPARRHQRHQRHRRAVGVRQHQADRLALRRERHQFLAEDARAHQELAIAQRARHRVLDRDAAHAVDLRGFDQRLRHRALDRGGAVHEVRHDLVERCTRGDAAVLALERRIDRELDRLEHRHPHLGEPAAAHLGLRQPGERRGVEAFEPHRHHEGFGLVGDEARAVIDLHQAAGDREPALREDDQRIAAFDGVDQRARRHRLGRIDRQRAGEAKERLDPPFLGHLAVDGEHRILRQDRHGHRGIEEARVVQRDDRVWTGVEQIVDALELDAVDRAEQDRQEVHHRIRRHGLADQDGDDGGRCADDQTDRRVGELQDMLILQHRNEQRAADHEGCVEDVDRGDNPGAMIGARPGLHGREGRHDVQAAADRKAGEIDCDPDPKSREDRLLDARLRRVQRQPVSRPAQIERKQGDADRTDKRRQQDDASGGQPSSQAGAHRDRDREYREINRDHFLGAAEQVLHQRRHECQHHGADQPEPARHQTAPPQLSIAAQMSDEFDGGACDIFGNNEIRRTGADLGDQQARAPAQQCEHQHQAGGGRGVAAAPGREPADDGAEQNGHEGRAFDQSVGGRQRRLRQKVRQDAVFDRTKQRADHAEACQRHEQHRQRMHPEAEHRDDGDADFGELEPLSDDGLVEAVGDLAAKRGQYEIGGDEHCCGKLHERVAAISGVIHDQE